MSNRSDTQSNRTGSPDQQTDKAVLVADGIDFEYGTVSVLSDVSISIPEAAVTALIGPNGSGKTTLIRALAGLHEPTTGSIRYLGPETSRPIGYLPQHPAFRPGFSVRETLSFYASLVGADERDAMERLERVGLEAAAERPVQALSGGMTRLLGVAQATVGDPSVVVLDEPGSGLDPGMSAHVFEVAADLADEGTAVLLSSHDLELVERTADFVAVLDGGTLTERGSPNDVRSSTDAGSLLEAYETAIGGERARVRVIEGETA